jgi:hypothetical protein
MTGTKSTAKRVQANKSRWAGAGQEEAKMVHALRTRQRKRSWRSAASPNRELSAQPQGIDLAKEN